MYCGDIEQLGDIGKLSLKKAGKVISAPIKQAVRTVTHPVATVKQDVARVKAAFKSGNPSDPFAAIASITSPSLRPIDAQLRAAGVKGGAAMPADKANKYLAKAIGTTGKGFAGSKPASIIGLAATGYGLATGAGAGAGSAASAAKDAAKKAAQQKAAEAAKQKAAQVIAAQFSDPGATGGDPGAIPDEVLPEAVVTPHDYTPWIIGGAAALLLAIRLKSKTRH